MAADHLSMLNNGPENYPEPRTWSKVPDDKWEDIRWDAIHALYLNPFMVQPNWQNFEDALNGTGIPIPTEPQYSFGIDHLETRDAKYPGTIDARIYWAKSVAGVLKKYDLDGYDIDYEYNTGDHETQLTQYGNIWEFVPKLLAQIRAELDQPTKADTNTPKRQYYVSITPANSINLDNTILDCVSHVNVQTYDGGWAMARGEGTPDTAATINNAFQPYIDLGYANDRLLFGIMPGVTYATYEGSTPTTTLVACSGSNNAPKFSPSLELAPTTFKGFKGSKLAGIHSWQINNDDQLKFETRVQVVVHNELHDTVTPLVNDPPTCNRTTLATDWRKLVQNGGGAVENWKKPT